MKFSIIIPAYNEEENLEAAVKGLISSLKKKNILNEAEILIFDDHSRDKTGEIADNLGLEIKNIRVFHNKENKGLGFNFWEGARQALGEYVALFPGDNENLPGGFVDILYRAGEADIIITYTSNMEVRPMIRRIISWTYTYANNLLFGLKLRYYNGLSVYKRDLLLKLPPISNSFSYAAEILVLLLRSGATYIELPMELVPKKLANTSAFRLKNIKGVLMGISGLFWKVRIKKNNFFSERSKFFRSFFKKITLFFFSLGKSFISGKASILMYHSIGKNPAFFTVTPENFDKQMAYLSKENKMVIKLSDLAERLRGKKDISDCVCLTFDDGFLDNITNALPILKKYNFPATIFVTTNFLGGQMTNSEGVSLPIVSDVDIQKFSSEQIEFMPHTASHSMLNVLSEIDYDKELSISRNKIEELAKRSADLLAYPKGRYNQSVINYLSDNGWIAAVTVEPGLVDGDADLYKLKRNGVYAATPYLEFKVLVSKRLEKYLIFKKWIKKRSGFCL